MVRRLKKDDAMLEDVGCRSKGVPEGIDMGVGEPVREASGEISGDDSLSVVAGVVEYEEDELTLASLLSLKFEDVRVMIAPMRFLIEIGLEPAMLAGKQLLDLCGLSVGRATKGQRHLGGELEMQEGGLYESPLRLT